MLASRTLLTFKGLFSYESESGQHQSIPLVSRIFIQKVLEYLALKLDVQFTCAVIQALAFNSAAFLKSEILMLASQESLLYFSGFLRSIIRSCSQISIHPFKVFIFLLCFCISSAHARCNRSHEAPAMKLLLRLKPEKCEKSHIMYSICQRNALIAVIITDAFSCSYVHARSVCVSREGTFYRITFQVIWDGSFGITGYVRRAEAAQMFTSIKIFLYAYVAFASHETPGPTLAMKRHLIVTDGLINTIRAVI